MAPRLVLLALGVAAFFLSLAAVAWHWASSEVGRQEVEPEVLSVPERSDEAAAPMTEVAPARVPMEPPTAAVDPVDLPEPPTTKPSKPVNWDSSFGLFEHYATLVDRRYFNPDRHGLDEAEREQLQQLLRRINSDLSFIDRTIDSRTDEILDHKVAIGDYTRIPVVPKGQLHDVPSCPYPMGKYGVRVRLRDDPHSDGKIVAYLPFDLNDEMRSYYEEREKLYEDSAEEIRELFRSFTVDEQNERR